MENQTLIPLLIQQDMKHTQLVEAICLAGFESDLHHLGLLEIVARLMGIPEDGIPDEWVETYMEYLGKAALYPITARSENLEGLARECYAQLVEEYGYS